MIRTFRDRGLRRLHERQDASKLGADQAERIAIALADLDTAKKPRDMDLPGYRLHWLKGDLNSGRHAMEMSEVIAAGALVFSIVGLIYTHIQVRRTHREAQRTQISQRAKLVKELYDEIFDDDEFHHIYSLLEKEEPLFSPGCGASSPDEQRRRQRGIERLLSKLEGICGMYKSGLLEVSDLESFDYNIRRISQCEGFASYRRFLENEWPDLRQLERGPYASLFWYLDTEPPIKSERAHSRS